MDQDDKNIPQCPDNGPDGGDPGDEDRREDDDGGGDIRWGRGESARDRLQTRSRGSQQEQVHVCENHNFG